MVVPHVAQQHRAPGPISLPMSSTSSVDSDESTVHRLSRKLSAADLEPWMISVRRSLHAEPELSFKEHKTSQFIRQQLDKLGIRYDYPVARTGIVAHLGSGAPGSPCVALRADMDALPITELTGAPYGSTHTGCMHACGHDAHCAMLLGAAALLKARERELAGGRVKLLFQPAEEADGGGKVMVAEGVVADVDAAFALHVWPQLPAGTIATRPGPLMAGVLSFEATVKGRGGHAAMPHTTVNPVIAAASIVAELKPLVTAHLPPYEPVVVNVCHMSSDGEAFNVVPDTVRFGGTVRAFSDDIMRQLKQRLTEVVAVQARVHGCEGIVDFREDKEPYFPPLVNNPSMSDFARSVAKRVVGEGGVALADLTMASEDFAFIAQQVPACFAFLGVRNEERGIVHGLHSPLFDLDEGALKVGAAYLASLAHDYLSQRAAAATQRRHAHGTQHHESASSFTFS
eukprot:CAMPEP_0202862836 /NCGR_PEP_ID=MMETSP1391-20130828/3723_1 /ASSEMBLY_ACC=CAM_ASM_000867 /TAXON_ID=1034604 /ORGANISM="Chlamydomonas leiostraca, Strain SAG 11-49" /LENGTH=456 /DNA_ID=CAMNT_0049542413 /DNA_START=197 /DNA_END=1567 /DNA_ORIENTATION=-